MSFEIRILNQHWISPDAGSYDLCSHGEIYLNVNNTVLSDVGQDWTLNVTGLQLLRSLKNGRDQKNSQNQAMFNCCGEIFPGMGCPTQVDWDVELAGEEVRLSNFRNCPDGSGRSQHHPDLQARISRAEYREQVLTFARQAKEFYFTATKTETDDALEEFWKQYDDLLHTV